MKIMKKIKIISIVFSLLGIPLFLFAQSVLIDEFLPINYPLSEESIGYLDTYKKESRVGKLQLVRINTEIFRDDQISINLDPESILATKIKDRIRNEGSSSWFGTLEDESGIFFTVLEDRVMSKFRIGDYGYSIIPLENDIHMLIEINDNAKHPKGHTGCIHGSGRSSSSRPVKENEYHHHDHHHSVDRPNPSNSGGSRTDTDCVYRIAILYTDDAAANITDLAIFSQSLADEANLAYTLSGINLVAEVARCLEVNHAESDVLVDIPTFNNTDISADVVDFRNDGDGILDEIHDMSDRYQTDVQVMIRENPINVERFNNGTVFTVFGVSWLVDVIDPDDAFIVMDRATVPLGRFTFTHEIGHIQGADHDNEDPVPAYAKGYYFADEAAGRTLMAISATGICSTAEMDACRIGYFSNPDITVNGTVIGVENENDNARRLNETADRTRNYRMTNDDFTITAETIADGALSHHLANDRITTGGNAVVYEAGSYGTMRADREVVLEIGASVLAGSRFRAFLDVDPCEDAAPLPLDQPDTGLVLQREENNQLEVLDQNQLMIQPNPASNFIMITFQLEAIQSTTISIFNANGEVVKIVNDSILRQAGEHQLEVNIKNLPAGIYYCQLKTGQSVLTNKFVVSQ